MGKIWEFFENLNEYVYVVDMDKWQVVYMNKKARDTYGITDMEEIASKKCHELLHRCFAPCELCYNADLKEGHFREWQYYNPILDKYLLVKDTLIRDDGHRYRMEMSIDVSVQERQGRELCSHQNMEAFVNEGLRIALQAPTPDQSLDIVLEYLGKALKGERAYIFEKNKKGGDDNTYEWVADGVTPEKENLQELPADVCANWYRSFRESRDIIIEDVEDIREEDPLQYEVLKRQSIHSLVVVPLYDDKKVIGFYGIDNPPEGSLVDTSVMLQIMGHFIVSALRRRKLVRELRELSVCDQLTGFGNRRALNEYTEALQPGESLGVVYCDITGLKRINDTEGHAAGDKLILSGCDCLRRVFGDCGLFRIGGDELLALCARIGEAQMREKEELLRRDIRENGVSMSAGVSWVEDGRAELDDALTKAETLMYEDKAAYYAAAGMDRRR